MKWNDVDSCVDDLKKLYGLPPYDNWSNICAGDGYFSKSIQNSYSPWTLKEAEEIVDELQKEWDAARRAFLGERSES